MTKISDLIPDPRNANKGTVRGAAALNNSLRQNGAGRSILIDKNWRVIAGNKTVEQAADIGLDDVIVVQSDGTKLVAVQRTDLDLETDPMARELAWADNRVGQLDLEWEPMQLAADLEAGIDLSGLFNPEELSEILEKAGNELLGGGGGKDVGTQIDRAEELQEKWQVKPGDIWQVDRHFFICGDCREQETWKRLLAAAGVDCVNGVFTSPPYAEQRKKQYGGIPTAEYVQWWEAVQANVKDNLASDGSFFVNIKPHCEDGQRVLYVFDLVLAMVRAWGWKFVDELSWIHQGVMGKWPTRFKNRFEPIYQFCQSETQIRHENVIQPFTDRSLQDDMTTYTGVPNLPDSKNSGFKDKSKKSAIYDGALPGNIIEVSLGETAATTDAYQAATFPVRLPTFFIKAYSDPGDFWLDPFLGSGTVICAAHNEGRTGLGIEKLEKYCAVILERLQQLTGQQPVLLRAE